MMLLLPKDLKNKASECENSAVYSTLKQKWFSLSEYVYIIESHGNQSVRFQYHCNHSTQY